jgi:hypothetical protein
MNEKSQGEDTEAAMYDKEAARKMKEKLPA